MSATGLWRNLFRHRWPFRDKAQAVIGSYVTVGVQHRLFLTDIALDNHVFGPGPEATNLFQAGVAEGRRRCALEIFERCSVNPQLLWELVEQRPGTKE